MMIRGVNLFQVLKYSNWHQEMLAAVIIIIAITSIITILHILL